jgi:hypothetical protein
MPVDEHGCRVRHHFWMTTRWSAWVTWRLFYRLLRNVLIEDSLDTVTGSLGFDLPCRSRWSPSVRVLRSLAQARRRALTRSPG